MKPAHAAPLLLALAACGGGGTGGAPVASSTSAAGNPDVRPTPVPGFPVTGSVSALPAADTAPAAPLAGATVIIGPLPVTGATPPALLPAGDVSAITDAAGTFAATLSMAAAAPSSAEPFVLPQNNILGFAAPAAGYYVSVFGPGTDGRSAGFPLPLHRFVAASGAIMLTVSLASTAEAAALANVNADRAADGAGPLIFDESAQDVARLHASDESANGYTCHYDLHNAGPASRYLAAGGIGLTGEALALVTGTPSVAFANAEAAFLAEKNTSPQGSHYLNLIDGAHQWAGVAAVTDASAPAFANVDYELVTPGGSDTVVGASGYPVSASCPPGTTVNNS